MRYDLGFGMIFHKFFKSLCKRRSEVVVADYQSYLLGLEHSYCSVSCAFSLNCAKEAVSECKVSLGDVRMERIG